MKCDNEACGREIQKDDSHFIAKEVPALGFSRYTDRLWSKHLTFCSKTCLLAFLHGGGEL